MTWIKKGNVIALAVAILLLSLFCWLFLDGLIKRALVSAGQAAAGAKVEISSVETKLLKGTLEVRGIAVANKNEPMSNLFELEQAAFSFLPAALLRGKAVVPDSGLRGFRFGTARKTSGALPNTPPSRIGKIVSDQLTPAKKTFDADFGKAKATIDQLDPKALASLKGLDAAQDKLKGMGEEWKGKLNVDGIDAQIKDIQAQVKAIQQGGNSPADIARKAAAAAETQKKVKTLLSQVEGSRSALTKEFGDVQAKLKEADELRKKDVNGLLEAAGLPSLDAESLTKHLLGPAASQKIATAVQWISWARKRQAAQTAKAKAKPEARRKGINFEFPRAYAYPAFLLERSDLTGKLDAVFQGRDMDIKGVLTGVTSNPPLYGKPARLTLSGAAGAGGPTMQLQGTMDQTKPVGVTEVQLRYAGLPLSGVALGDGQVGAALKGGVGRLDGTIRITGDQWKGQVILNADDVSLSPSVNLAGPAAGFASAALSGVRRFSLTIGIEGQEDDLKFKISSDLGQTLADGMKKAFSAELQKQRAAIEAKVNELYAGRAKELQARSADLQKQLLAPLDKQKAALDEALRNAVPKLGGNKNPLEGLFKKR